MPAVFGLCVANHVMLEITGYPHEYVTGKVRDKMYDGILAQLQGLEERLANADGAGKQGVRMRITSDDVGYLVEEVFRGRSVISGLASRLALARWRKPVGKWIDDRTPGQRIDELPLDALVCMTKDEMLEHEKLVLKGDRKPEDVYDQEVLDRVEARWREERGMKTRWQN
nr:hypothetical protein B0A51_15086 [Rachicladosporium sp. CCFEE 5018]